MTVAMTKRELRVELKIARDCLRRARGENTARENAAYARGRADERADVVACLGDFVRITGGLAPIATIERGGHVGAAKKEKP